MTRIKIDGTVRDLLTFYKEERKIFGRCPHCGDVFRLSEAKLTYGKEPPRDLLARLKRERDQFEARAAELDEEISTMEEEHSSDIEGLNARHRQVLEDSNARWRERVDVEVDRHLRKKIKDIRQKAIANSRVTTLGKTIERIAPMFSGFGHHPGDVRPLFEPVDFVIFSGLFTGEVTDIVFVEFKTGGSSMSETQRTIRDAVARKRVHFEERRMSAPVLKRLALGRRIPRNTTAIEAGRHK